jgi:hypothetical protein
MRGLRQTWEFIYVNKTEEKKSRETVPLRSDYLVHQDPPPFNQSRCYKAVAGGGSCSSPPVDLENRVTQTQDKPLNLSSVSVSEVVQLQPQAASFHLRPGHPASLTITAGHAEDYPGQPRGLQNNLEQFVWGEG